MNVRENGRSFQMPFRILRGQTARFMTWPVNATPKNRLGYQGFLRKPFGIPKDSLSLSIRASGVRLTYEETRFKRGPNDNQTISNVGNYGRPGRGAISAAW